MRTIEHSVELIEQGLASLAETMSNPEELQLSGTRQSMERLQETLGYLAGIHASFAYLCQRDDAGSLVGATHPVEYLTQRLGVSRATAFEWLSRGQTLFGEPSAPREDKDDPDPAREQEAERRRAAEKAAQSRARKAAKEKQASEEKHRIIRNALRALNEHSNPGYRAVYAEAMDAATRMNPEELRSYVDTLVRRANRNGRDLGGKVDPFAAFKKRTVVFGAEDGDGGSWMKLYVDRAHRALIEAALAGGDAPGSHLPGGAVDMRTKRQRRFDHLLHILRSYSVDKARRQSGVGTVVVTLTLEDLLNADPPTVFPSNTGTPLTALDLAELGLAGDSFVLQLDSATGVPLSLGRARFASIEEKIALLALQSVCAWNGCTKPGIELEAHHLVSYLDGGMTSLDNLVLLCREHHRCNNDRRDGEGGKGYFTKDPVNGEVRYHSARGGPPMPTRTHQYRQAPGQRTAAKARGARHSRAPDPAIFD
ncbi:HNH endonuclease [Corynebacterium capitovis DSM 44611]|uniref:HNH endonuclease signature motif containing protein n=1 Tax=Corynebacterium capitovis TaxID=131081 RepID=UPI00036E1C2F|nr:HNH endonuclease signature motif containing protein [Corynebacterium capitovis]WKD57997.1 HNH endonuclease [Corynebacterium capitovis DSM 44611]